MTDIRVTELNIYPIKSCAGVSLSKVAITNWGADRDRRFMLVDANGKFITARKHHGLVLVKAVSADKGLMLSAPGMSGLYIEAPDQEGAALEQVQVWKDEVSALFVDARADAWFSEFLGEQARLVYIPERSFRQVDQAYYDAPQKVSFADAYPVLATSESSLEDLNGRLKNPVKMTHFRPNIVVAGADSFAEDHWRRLRIGEVEFVAVKPCSRCVFTTIDPASGHKSPDTEPLRTLASYRKTELGAIFGQNLVQLNHGIICVGDKVELLD
ncbi:MOSC domain-containing protein [Hahella sp. KA22]|uniref:MOSC domain-containing protein n=1 Tax=Hahella sp. KA22 TaxID=1628392 RepID=UPI000FDF2813|nr:MOSC domain-containing protein [Hahella sp. KA22]AZZ91340.1 MOSC domain-containing protein [Hahella sp. KA22]QAY54710.1 MOSC domain-containing protein [Hahella sp. KA22]